MATAEFCGIAPSQRSMPRAARRAWPASESDAARLSHSALSNRCPRNREFSLHVPEVTGGGGGGGGDGGKGESKWHKHCLVLVQAPVANEL